MYLCLKYSRGLLSISGHFIHLHKIPIMLKPKSISKISSILLTITLPCKIIHPGPILVHLKVL